MGWDGQQTDAYRPPRFVESKVDNRGEDCFGKESPGGKRIASAVCTKWTLAAWGSHWAISEPTEVFGRLGLPVLFP